MPVATAGDATAFREVAGLVQFTPATASDNAGVTLRVPYYLVPRAKAEVGHEARQAGRHRPVGDRRSHEQARRDCRQRGLLRVGARGQEGQGQGVERHPRRRRAVVPGSRPAADPDRALIVFAVNTHNRWSNASVNEFDIGVDVDGDGIDRLLSSSVSTRARCRPASFNGIMGSFVFSTRSGGASIVFLADAATDSSTALLPVTFDAALPRRLNRASASGEPALRRTAPSASISTNGGVDVVPGTAKFNVWTARSAQAVSRPSRRVRPTRPTSSRSTRPNGR